MMWGFGHFGPGFGLFGGGLMMLWWIAVLVGLVVLVARLIGGEQPHMMHAPSQSPVAPSPSSPAVRIAEERYARGEITREEYLDIRTTLGA